MTRAAAYQMLDELSEADLDRVAAFVRAFKDGDRLGMLHASAPEVDPEPDEEPASEDEMRNAKPFEEVCARLGISIPAGA